MLLEDAKKNMNVRGLSEKQVTTDAELQTILRNGLLERKTEENGVNATSSRSHAVLQLMLRQGKKQVSKMAFIDLAGSEKGSDVSEMSKQTKIDGAEINKSLLALKECIRALEKDNDYVNYRQSKLTLVLRDCFIGPKCFTTMITQISPAEWHCQETLNTLR